LIYVLATILLDSLVVGMAKVEPMVDSINGIKTMLQQKQRFEH
jgi:hypothetical protein